MSFPTQDRWTPRGPHMPLNQPLEWYRKRGWVVGPTLHVVFALHELQEGDKVVLIHTNKAGFPPDSDGLIVTIEPHYYAWDSGMGMARNLKYSKLGTVAQIICVAGDDEHELVGYVLAQPNIFAWRRPRETAS